MAIINEINSNHIYNAFINGALHVISNRHELNRINVFPVQDGDTGSNLSSMMNSMIHASVEEETVKETLMSFSEAALVGARGNSGIIFAQYLYGLSLEIDDQPVVTLGNYAIASKKAVEYAYSAIEVPVEGTMITVMRTWGDALFLRNDGNMNHNLSGAMDILNIALTETQYQLGVLKKAKVVDAGAKGFTLFIHGVLEYFKNGKVAERPIEEEVEPIEYEDHGHQNLYQTIQYRYCTEGLFEQKGLNKKKIHAELSKFGDSLIIANTTNKARVHIHTNTPADVFAYLYSTGKVLSQKVDDMKKQQDVLLSRKSDIAILTDSIADLPQALIDLEQIHVIHLNILFQDTSFIDKLTIKPKELIAYSSAFAELPTSSQPDEKQIESIMTYLKTQYKSVIVLTVSKELSGTYANIKRVADRMITDGFHIDVINTKQNSGAQGLLVKRASEMINDHQSHEQIVEKITGLIDVSKILVRVKNLDNMVKSGRLSTRAGRIGKMIGLKPIVTLDQDGKGALDSIAFSDKGSQKSLVKHLKKLMKHEKVDCYNIVHVNNLIEAEALATFLTEYIGKAPEYITETSSIVAVGAGDGAVALSYILVKET